MITRKKLIKIKPGNVDKIKEKEEEFNTVSEPYNKGFENHYD